MEDIDKDKDGYISLDEYIGKRNFFQVFYMKNKSGKIFRVRWTNL